MRRPQVSELTADDDTAVVVRPLPTTDRMHNPDDITVDTAAIAAGLEHGGTQERRAEELNVRGTGGRKRSQTAPPTSKHRSGRDRSKQR